MFFKKVGHKLRGLKKVGMKVAHGVKVGVKKATKMAPYVEKGLMVSGAMLGQPELIAMGGAINRARNYLEK